MRASLGTAATLIATVLASSPAIEAQTAQPPKPKGASFTDVTATSAVTFQHRHFGTGQKYMPENMGSGVAGFDANGDGLLDLYFVQSAPWSAEAAQATPLERRSNRLYLRTSTDAGGDGDGDGDGDGAKWEATDSGLNDTGYGMGVAIGDIDRDGHQDVFITNFGSNRLYRAQGNGRFIDETSTRLPNDASNGEHLWSTGATFFDADHDGDLDLYVVNYLDFSVANHKFCGSAARKLRSYCHPDIYQAQPDVFYRNRGDGTFETATVVLGFSAPKFAAESKGLAVLAADLTGNSQTDVFVANDSTRNLFFVRDGQAFREDGLLAGIGYSGAGQPEASMGIAAGDINHDGRLDLLLTHLDQETNTLYLNQGDGLFSDQTSSSGLAGPSLPWVGFGTQLFDMDLDGDLDLVVVNGHIIDNIAEFDPHRSYRQPAQLFENLGNGRFVEVSERLGLTNQPLVGRAAVAADWDQDGDLDLVFTQNNGAPLLLRNNLEGGRSVTVRLASKASAPSGIGARIKLVSNHPTRKTQVRWMNSTTGYLSQPPHEVVLAVPKDTTTLTLEILWPAGATTTHTLPTTARSQLSILSEPPRP